MLVKLGEFWVVPNRVEGIRIEDNSSDFNVTVLTQENRYFQIIESLEEAKKIRDEYASIVNGSISQQTFGGEDDKTSPTS